MWHGIHKRRASSFYGNPSHQPNSYRQNERLEVQQKMASIHLDSAAVQFSCHRTGNFWPSTQMNRTNDAEARAKQNRGEFCAAKEEIEEEGNDDIIKQ